MPSGTCRVVALSILLCVLIGNFLFAGTTGKIAGRVLDKETGEPMPGVNVIVKGTTLGASTDVDGYYAILYVPPGVHTVVASMVGYATVTVNEVRVRIDETSPVDITLERQAIEVGEIAVVAERNIVRQDVSTSVVAVQPEEVAVLPITSIDNLLSLQAGVDKDFVVRGGSADQLLFQIDGFTMRDPRNNNPITTIALSSIQEVSLERGGFNAEYGQVRSGVLNIVEKEGDAAHYFGSATVKYAPPQQKYFGMSVYDPNSMWNRPYLDPAVCWTGTQSGAWDIYTQRQYPFFEGWNAKSQAYLTDTDPTNDLSPAAAQRVWEWERRRTPNTKAPDYNVDGGFGGPVPFVSRQLGNLRFFTSFRLERDMLLIPLSRDDYKDYNWSMKLNADISDKTHLLLNAATGKSYNVAINENDKQFNNPAWGINGVAYWNPTDYMRSPFQIAEITNEQRPSRIFDDNWYSEGDVSDLTFGGKLTHFLSASTFYEVSVENVNRQYRTGPTYFRDTSKVYEVVPGYFVDEAPFGYDPRPLAGITSMFFGGHNATSRDSSKLSSYVLKGDLTSQLSREHLVKTGIEFSYYDLNLSYGLVNPAFSDVNYVQEHWKPYRLSAYVQDKIETHGFIANIGVRMDLSNPNTDWVTVDPFDKSFFSTAYDPNAIYPQQRAKIDVALSPRLGISHPITENSKLYFNYGHFKQMPAYEEIFRIGRGSAGNIRNYGDPSLIQAKTISYELGYDHVLFDTYLIQLAAFYHDISDQQAYTAYLSDRKGIGYFAANNDSYADIRGFELTLRKSYGDWVRGFATYTYQVTTSGAFGKATINEDPSQQILIDRNTPNLYQQKPIAQPRANASITFLTPGDFGPNFLGLQPFGTWDLNVLAQWRAGEWINYNPNQVTEIGTIVQNVQVKDFYNIDLRLNKTFDFDRVAVTLIMEVRNLLNSKFLSGGSFYDIYDQNFYFESLHLPSSSAYDNIPGEDRVGEVRKEGVAFVPIEQAGTEQGLMDMVMPALEPGRRVLGYVRATGQYWEYRNGSWEHADQAFVDQVLKDKAYIDMPNNFSFDFLNPRQFFYGITLSLKL
jgi:outer membrane receptor protein involved in Fe transport